MFIDVIIISHDYHYILIIIIFFVDMREKLTGQLIGMASIVQCECS